MKTHLYYTLYYKEERKKTMFTCNMVKMWAVSKKGEFSNHHIFLFKIDHRFIYLRAWNTTLVEEKKDILFFYLCAHINYIT